jgi:hypothetical protein
VTLRRGHEMTFDAEYTRARVLAVERGTNGPWAGRAGRNQVVRNRKAPELKKNPRLAEISPDRSGSQPDKSEQSVV